MPKLMRNGSLLTDPTRDLQRHCDYNQSPARDSREGRTHERARQATSRARLASAEDLAKRQMHITRNEWVPWLVLGLIFFINYKVGCSFLSNYGQPKRT